MALRIRRLEHIGIVVDNLEETRQFLEETLGLKADGESQTDTLRTAFFTAGHGARLELIEVFDPTTRARRLGDSKSAHIEHIAVEVDDVKMAIAALEAVGVAFTAPPRVSGRFLTTWTEPATTRGVMLQLVQAVAPDDRGPRSTADHMDANESTVQSCDTQLGSSAE